MISIGLTLRQVDAILFLDVRALLWTSCKRLLAWRRYLQVCERIEKSLL